MGYIKKLKNNELVGGTDKTTIYPVTSTKAVFEEITEGNESSFKTQETINGEHDDRIKGLENVMPDTVKSITINGGTEHTVDESGNVDLTIYTVNPDDPDIPAMAELVEQNRDDIADIKEEIGTDTTQNTLSGRITELETLVGGNEQGSVNQRIEAAVNALDVLPGLSSNYNSNEGGDYNVHVGVSLEEEDGKIKNLNLEAENIAPANKLEELYNYTHDLNETDVVVGAKPAASDALTNTIYRVPSDPDAAHYTDYMKYDGQMVPLATYDIAGEEAQVGCYTGTISGTALSVTVANNPNTSISAYDLKNGGHFKIKVPSAATNTTGGWTLSVKGLAAKQLLYNGEVVSRNNTWEAGETISVYYDNTANNGNGSYFASNAQGGSNRKIDAYLYEDLRALTVGQIYRKNEIVKTTDKQFLRITKSIEPMTLVDVIAVNDLKVNGSNTYKSKVAINSYNSTTTYSDGQFAIGNPSEISIAVNKGITDGNISVSFGENTPQTIAIVNTDNVSSVVSKICTSLNSIANVGWEFESLGGTIVKATCLTNGDNSQTEFSLTNADSSIITGVTAEPSINSVGDDSTPTILHLTVSIGEGTISVTLGETTNEVEVASTDDSNAIATKIAEKTFSGWTVSSSNNVVTALCNTGGNNSTSDFYITDIDKIGVSSEPKTIIQAGSIGLSVYDSNDGWASVSISEYVGNSDIWDVVTEEDIITLATEQNNIPKLYDTLGENTDGALTQKASKEILFNAIDEGLTRERQVYINLKHNDNYSIRYSDGVRVSTAANLKQWASDYIFLKKGTLITLNNAGVDASYSLLSIYREKDEKSYIQGYKGSGRTVRRSLSYTATEDVYAKISSCYDVRNTSFYMTLTGTEKSDAIFKSITLSARLFPELYYANLQFTKRTQSRGNVLCVEGLECVRIKANSTHAVKVALLNDIPSDISTADGIAPNFYIPGEFHIGANNSVLINVEGFKYLFFYGSTDLFPNAFPVTVDYFYKGAHTIAEELDNSFRVEPQPVDIPITVHGYTNLSSYIDVEGAERIKYCLYAASNYPSYFYDANKKVLGFFEYGNSEGYTTREIALPLGTKYIRYRTKTNNSSVYIKVYYPYITNAQEIEDKINAVDAKLTNAGYHYLAGSYGISTSSEDNSDALQTLVNTINYNGGGIIEMPVGNFKFKKGIIWKSNVSLIGQGQEVTVLEMVGTNSFSLFSGDNVNNISFSDFSVVASSMSASIGGKAMFMRYIEDAVFENLKLVDTQLTSLGIDFLNRVKILNCNVINGGRGRWVAVPSGVGCSGIGIGMGWSGHQENFINSNCICKGCYNNGIFVEDQGRFASGGTVMADGSGQIISNCICRGGRNAGFSIWGGKNVIFANNLSYENTNAGFEIGYYAIDGTFVGNQSQGNGTGFKIGSIQKASSHIRFTNNEIKGNTTGVSIATAALTNHIVIKDNDLYNNGTAMSISGNSTGLVIRDNNEYGSTTGVTLSGTHTDAIIKGNAFMTSPNSTATFAGNTSYVEQLN